jgi:phage terminase large subunit GpA-like protein
MDAVSDPRVHEVVLMTSAQVGKTEIINNTVGFYVDRDPAPILVIQPTLEMGEAWSKDRLSPMLRDTPALQGKVKDARARNSGNTLLHKSFPGGHITIAGANSPVSLASRPIRILLCDEVDKYPPSAGTEGDPVSLARKRTTTFWNSKTLLVSTPTIQGASRIEAAYDSSDKRQYLVPCPNCGEKQILKWQRVKWEKGKPSTARYQCQFCDGLWTDASRHKAVKLGEWQATEIFNGVAGFHLNELYSPWVSLAEMAASFAEAEKGGQEQLKAWINTSLGETWQEKGDAPEWERLYDRREAYPIGIVPRGALILTAGADVQKDRIEVQVIGWGRGKENWSVDYKVLEGDTSRGEVWRRLTEQLGIYYPREQGGEMPVQMLGVDSGYATNDVYAWAREQRGTGRVIVVKGAERAGVPIGTPTAVDVTIGGKRIARGIKVWPVSVGIYKSELYGFLRLPRPVESEEAYPPGYPHFPQYDAEYFKQLTAEQLVTRIHKGYRHLEWQQTRARNEALDNWVYARAAAAVLGLDRYGERQWRELEGRVEAKPKPPMPSGTLPPPSKPPAPKPGWLGPRHRNWLDRGSGRGWLR